ncbi:MAG: ABC transporter ATP-binding protein [Alphaproteobacteria bacterium]|nr:ABC transporter ATP-binding protein [Alphaproteobacteria bacterium]
MASVQLRNVAKRFGAQQAMDDVSLEIPAGSFLTLLGPSGCGKTTTLRSIAGLVTPDAGTITIDGEDVTALPVHRRRLAMVFQSHALFPHMRVIDNVAFGLRMRGSALAARRAAAREALAQVRLEAFESRWPHELSGGQQQRVAIARALVVGPRVLLLDEPFGALDRKLREAMQAELRELTRRLGMTAVFVTHDQEEALLLSDRIAVMNAGRIEQIGTPGEIFELPATRFVADFMGVDNILEVEAAHRGDGGCALSLDGAPLDLPAGLAAPAGNRVWVGIRPERMRLAAPGSGHAATVVDAVYLGTLSSYRVRLAQGGRVLAVREVNVAASAGGPRLAAGAKVGLVIPPDSLRILDADRGGR